MNNRRYWNTVISSIGAFMGQNLMQVVDLLFCRTLGAEGTAVMGSATALVAWFIILGLGVLWSLEYFIPHSLGAGDEYRAQSFYYAGFTFAGGIGIASGIGLAIAAAFTPAFGIQEAIIPKVQSFCYIVALGYLPIFLSSTGRVELQARGFPQAMTWAFVYGNILNIFLNWVMVLGNLGFPALGTDGSAWANTISRYFILAYILIRVHYARKNLVRVVTPTQVNYRKFMREIFNMGFPTSLHMIFEIGAFALVGTLAGHFMNAKNAAHAIAISIASLAFMIPMGMSSAASLTMSEANGEGKPSRALALGWLTIRLGVVYAMAGSAVIMLGRHLLVGAYTEDPETIAVGSTLLLIAGFFQFGDAMQVILAGCIRGFGETRVQARMNGIGHWLIGIPLGLFLGYGLDMEIVGLWIGLCVGLFVVAGCLWWKWRTLVAANTPHSQ